MYKFLVVGHGNFPTGLVSSFEMLSGAKKIVQVCELSESKDFNFFEEEISEILKVNDKWIIFADLTGGSPAQTVLKTCVAQSKDFILVSGVNLAILLEVYFRLGENNFDFKMTKKIIDESIQQSKEMIQIIDNSFLKEA